MFPYYLGQVYGMLAKKDSNVKSFLSNKGISEKEFEDFKKIVNKFVIIFIQDQ